MHMQNVRIIESTREYVTLIIIFCLYIVKLTFFMNALVNKLILIFMIIINDTPLAYTYTSQYLSHQANTRSLQRSYIVDLIALIYISPSVAMRIYESDEV